MSVASPPPEARRRLFFALWPDPRVRSAIATAFGPAIAAAGGRPVPAANLHLTLEFLGAVAESRVGALTDIGRQLVLPAVEVALDAVDWWRGPALLVATAAVVPPALLALQAELRQQLVATGCRVESRPFRAHVTLARAVAARPVATPHASVAWPVRELALIESCLDPGGVRYTPLARWPEGG